MVQKTKTLTANYIKSFVLISIMIGISVVVLFWHTSNQKYYSNVLNVSGRQRMYSQKIARYVEKRQSSEEGKLAISQVLNLMMSRHNALLDGDQTLDLPRTKDKRLRKKYKKASQYLVDMERQVNCLLEGCPPKGFDSESFVEANYQFLVAMDDIVNLTEEIAEHKLNELITIEFVLAALLLFMVIVIYFNLVLPANELLLQQVAELEKKTEISEKIEELADVGLWELDAHTNKLNWSDQIYKIHALPVGSPIEKLEAIEYYAPQERERLSQHIEDCIHKKLRYDDEFEFFDRKGKKKWVRTIGIPLMDHHGNVTKLMGIFQDLTYRKKIEKQIIETKRYFELAVEGSGLGIWDWQLETNHVKYDKRWAEMLGLKLSQIEMDFSTWRDRVHPDDLKPSYDKIALYMEGKTALYENVHRMRHADGHWVHIMARGRFSEWNREGKPTRFTGTHLDITDMKKLEGELQFVLNSMQIGTWKWDIKTDHLECDDNMYKLYGVDRTSFILDSKSWKKLVHKDDIESLMRQSEEAMKTKDVNFVDSEFAVNRPDGEVRCFASKSYIVRGPDNVPVQIYGILWDRTHEVEAEKRLEEQKQLTFHNAKLASIGELAAGVAHEINNPLAIIKGNIDSINLMAKMQAAELHEKFIPINERINIAINRISNIVDGLRNFSRVDMLEEEKFDFFKSIEESILLVKQIYLKAGVEIESDIKKDPKHRFLLGNRGKIQQVFMNLLSNAKDATVGRDKAQIIVRAYFEENAFKLEVSDNGNGISQKHQDKVFDPFFTTKSIGQGTGIGLSLCHSIVREHDGTIDFSTSKEGTTFRVTFPNRKPDDLNIQKESSV